MSAHNSPKFWFESNRAYHVSQKETMVFPLGWGN